VIYESLALQACGRIREARLLIDRRERGSIWRRLARRLIGSRGPREAARLAQSACPVCENVRQSEEHYAHTLTDMLAYPKYRAKFEPCDGVCLAHLETAARVATSSDGLRRYLLTHTEHRLRALAEASRHYQDSIQNPEVIACLGNEAAERAISLFAGDGGLCCDPRWRHRATPEE